MLSALEVLKTIHEKMQDPENWDKYGICGQIDKVARQITDCNDEPAVRYATHAAFERYAAKWEYYSGSYNFPIPDPKTWDKNTTFRNLNRARERYLHSQKSKERMWDRQKSAYAALRWELLEFVIEKLEEYYNAEMAS